MRLLKRRFLIGFLLFPLTMAHANDLELALQEADKDIEIYQGGVEIRTLTAHDIRDVRENITDIKSNITDIKGNVTDVHGSAVDVNQAVSDLNADIRENEIFIQLSSELLFDFDKTDLKSEALETLNNLATVIRNKAVGVVTIQGHTDSKGTDSYNQRLSERRADTIHKWLTIIGRVKADYKVEGLGESKPVAPNLTPDGQDNPEGRAKNRRVEIIIETRKTAD